MSVVARWTITYFVLCAFDVRPMKPDVDASTSNAAWTPSTMTDGRIIFDGNVTSEGPCAAHYCLQGNMKSNGRNAAAATKTYCHCDSDCWKRRDCCLNAWTMTIQHLMDNDRLECESVVTRHKPTGIKTTSLFAMLTHCPPDRHNDGRDHFVRDKCDNRNDFSVRQDPLAFVPVISHVTNVTYRNIFCAVCNQDYENVSFWKVDLSCRNHVSIQNASDALAQYLSSAADSGRSRRSKCNLEMNPVSPSGANPLPVAECLTLPVPPPAANTSPMVCECNSRASTSPKLSWLCRTIYAPVNYVRVRDGLKTITTFRNVYCVMCNRVLMVANDAREAVAIECHETKPSYMFRCPPFCAPVGSIRTRSFTLLMDVDTRRGGLVVGTSERCPDDGQIYDVFQQECRSIFCDGSLEGFNCIKQLDNSFRSNGTTTTKTTITRKQLEKQCRVRIRYSAKEFELDANGTTLTMRRTGRKYDQGDYEWELQGSTSAVVICADLRNNYVTKFEDAAFEYLTIGGSILSIVSLFLKITIFAVVPETRNFPDRIVFCLSVSLFIAQLLFATTVIPSDGVHHEDGGREQDHKVIMITWCVVTAVLAHYFFLTSFAWMSVLAFDVWRTFATTRATAVTSSTSKQKIFVRYSAYAWSSPLAVVSVAVALDLAPILEDDSPYRPYYGAAICWISGRLALLALFVIPVALLIGTNAIFFSLTAWNIRSTSRQASIAQRSKNVSRRRTQERQVIRSFSLYVKLGTVMGLTWIIGFVSIYARLALLWYAFTLLNTLQGVYILLAFTPFRKIRRAWLRLRHSIRCRSNVNQMYVRSGSGHLPLQRSSTKSSQVTQTSSSLQSQQQHQTMSAATIDHL